MFTVENNTQLPRDSSRILFLLYDGNQMSTEYIIRPSIGLLEPIGSLMTSRRINTLENTNSFMVMMDIVEMYLDNQMSRKVFERLSSNIPRAIGTIDYPPNDNFKFPNNATVTNLVYIISVVSQSGHYGIFSFMLEYLTRKHKPAPWTVRKILKDISFCQDEETRKLMVELLDRKIPNRRK